MIFDFGLSLRIEFIKDIVVSFIIGKNMLKRAIITNFLRKIKYDDEALVEIIEKTFSFLSDVDLYYTLNPGFGSIFTPFVFKDMKKVASIVIDTLLNNKNVLVFGDKDVDGIIGTFMFKDFLEKFKLILDSKSKIFFEVPEGDDVYGIVPEVVEEYADKVDLIVTVDNGISAVDALSRALEKNIKVIVTDHHELHNDDVLKLATAVVNPKVEGGDGVYLSGAGVGFLVIMGILLYYFYKGLHLVSFFETDDPNKVEVLEIDEFYPSFKVIDKENLENFISYLDKRNLVFIDKNHFNAFRKYLSNFLNLSDTRVFLFENIVKSLGFEFKFEEMSDKLGLMFSQRKSEKLFYLLFYAHLFGNRRIKDIIYDYIPLVGLTVLSDNMPFLSYNKFFVNESLKRLSKVNFDSVRYILSYTVGSKDNITYKDISIRLVPFINSAGRMGQAGKMVRLLLSKNVREIEEQTVEISNLNDKRKRIVDEYIRSVFLRNDNSRVIVDDRVERGLISLISTKISSYVDYPVVVMSNGGNGEIFSGSARFRRGNIFEIIRSLSHHLENFGGHKKAAGFLISKSKIDDFVRDFMLLDYEKYLDRYSPILGMDILKFRKMANFFYHLEPLNDDLKPVFEDEAILQDYKIENHTRRCYVMVKDEWFLAEYGNDKIRELVGEKVRIVFSYEYAYDNKLQETLFIPKILEIRKC